MCNALCLGCVRTDAQTFNSKKLSIPDKQYIKFDTFKKILTAPEFSTVAELEFCGTIDDPLMHPEFLEFLEFAADYNSSYNVLIHTNASLRNEEYWSRMAKILRRFETHFLKFSIDGLEDTNHLYRQNTTWTKIMANAQAFIQSGGYAFWQYLIFPWNEHQIMEAKELSIKMGFKEFVSRHDRSVATRFGLERIQQRKQINRHNNPYRSTVIEINQELSDRVDNPINCNNKNKRMYFIGYDSRLWPCCFLHNGEFNADLGKRDLLEKRLNDIYGNSTWNDISQHSIGEILNHSFFTDDLHDSWISQNHDVGTKDRIFRCTEVCSVKSLAKLPIGDYKVL
jgi:MoaA/NifB/PqqE/SkfB family radical SAM enzyme